MVSPYFVGKTYEKELSFEDWQDLVSEAISLHFQILKPGAFLAINIADILAFPDPDLPRIQADNISNKKVKITREQVLEAQRKHPTFNKYQLAELLGCSEQTIDRRLKNNNVRGGKYAVQRKVNLVGGLVEGWGARRRSLSLRPPGVGQGSVLGEQTVAQLVLSLRG